MRTSAKLLFLVTFFLSLARLSAATWYIDGTATGAKTGKSWTDAWTNLAAATGIAAGDTVYISGGPAGSTQTYSVNVWANYPGQWGNVVNGVTYKIGQDAAHNGTAVFDGLGGSYWLVQGWKNVTISGDANDGQRHFKLINCTSAGSGTNWFSVRVSYIDFGSVPNGIDFNPATNIEVDHCYFNITGTTVDHFSYGQFSGTAYDSSTFHDNVVNIPYASAINGCGADGLQWNGSGYSVYNNVISGYPSSTYTGSQHQDGWQATGNGSYIKIYGNTFLNIVNYPVFQEPAFGGYSHTRIYDNIAICTNFTGSQAFVVSGSSTKTLTDCTVANNIAVNFALPFTFRNPSASASSNTFYSCYFYNNINVGGSNIIDANVTADQNITLNDTQATASFASYAPLSVKNDFHLKATATLLIGLARDASSLIGSLDKDGTPRVAWDVGPYSYSSLSLLAPSNTRVVASQ